MKQTAILLLLFCGLGLLAGQDVVPWQYVRHSAPDSSGHVHVRFNGITDIISPYQLLNWQNNSWAEVTPANPEPLVWEALLPAAAGQTLNYRLRADYEMMGQSITAVNPAYLGSDLFPPDANALALVNPDPAGDSINIYSPKLDLTGSWFGWSDNKLFAALTNAYGSFPLMNTLTSYNLYFAGLAASTTAVADSSVYAMIYTFNLPGIITPGLYKLGLNLADTTVTYQYLGPVQSIVSGGKLFLNCNISDLAADPGFGSWPPANNSLGFMAGSIGISIDQATLQPVFGIGDLTTIAQLVFEYYGYQVPQNTLPVISDWHVTETGLTKTLDFIYADADSDFPLHKKVVLDNSEEIDVFSLAEPDFTQPIPMYAELPFSGWNTGQIIVSDNLTDYVACDFYNVANQDETLPAPTALQAYPNPFSPDRGSLKVELAGDFGTVTSCFIYNTKGQMVRSLQAQKSGQGDILSWDGLTDSSQPAAAGIYLLKVRQGQQSRTCKVLLTR